MPVYVPAEICSKKEAEHQLSGTEAGDCCNDAETECGGAFKGDGMKKIEIYEPWFFLFFGLFHLHRIWGLIDRDSYADFWIGILENRGAFYYLLMGILAVPCVLGIITFFKNLNRNYWWRLCPV